MTTEQINNCPPIAEWVIIDAGVLEDGNWKSSYDPFVFIDFSRYEHGAVEYFDCSLERAADCLMQDGDYRAKEANGRDIIVSEYLGDFDPQRMDNPLITVKYDLDDWVKQQFSDDYEAAARRILMGCADDLENYLSHIEISTK